MLANQIATGELLTEDARVILKSLWVMVQAKELNAKITSMQGVRKPCRKRAAAQAGAKLPHRDNGS